MKLGRRGTGAVVGIVGVALMTGSAYLSWYGDHSAPRLPITYLVQALPSGDASSYWTSVSAPLAILGIVGTLGAAVRSRLLLGLAWLAGVTTLVLWGVMRAIASATAEAGETASTGIGPVICLVGTVVALAGIAIMGPRKEEVEAPLSMFDHDTPQ